MEIKLDDLTGSAIQELLREHLANMDKNSLPESVHGLTLEELRKPTPPSGLMGWSGVARL